MNITKVDKKAEAIERMRIIGLFEDIITNFEQDDIVYCCERPFGACYDLSDDQKKRIAEFENGHNCLVYLVERTYAEFGVLDTYFYRTGTRKLNALVLR